LVIIIQCDGSVGQVAAITSVCFSTSRLGKWNCNTCWSHANGFWRQGICL